MTKPSEIGRNRKRNTRLKKQRKRLALESLEDRRLLAADMVSTAHSSLASATPFQSSEISDQSTSADGRYVVFVSQASNLVAGDTNNTSDVFRYDRLNDEIDLVSINRHGTGTGNSFSGSPTISADGSRVAFESFASDLLNNDTNDNTDVFVRTFGATPSTTLVSVNMSGDFAADGGYSPLISANGNVVAFNSSSNDLVSFDSNGFNGDAFARTLSGTPTTTLLSSNSAGTNGGNSSSWITSVSDNGSVVAFESRATDLVTTSDTNNRTDVFVRDLGNSTATLISSNRFGTNTASDGSQNSRLSADGSMIIFESRAADHVSNDPNGSYDLFARPSDASAPTTLVSVGTNGLAVGGNTFNASISANGAVVAFESSSNALIINDANYSTDIFARTLAGTPTTILVSTDELGGTTANGNSTDPIISADGNVVAFQSQATNLVASDLNGNLTDIFARTINSVTTTMISTDSAGMGGNGSSTAPVLSPDGSVVVYKSSSSDLVPLDFNNRTDIFARAVDAATPNEVVSMSPLSLASASAAGTSEVGLRQSVSENGRYVVFESDAPNLAIGDNNNTRDVFRFDRLTGNIDLVSTNQNGTGTGNGASMNPVISADGMVVAFESVAEDLVGIDANGNQDIFVRTFAGTPATSLVSATPAGTASGNSQSRDPVLSADGSTVALVSGATNLIPNDTNAFLTDVFVRPVGGTTTVLVSANLTGGSGNASSDSPSLSADGSVISFRSTATDLEPIDSSNNFDIFRRTIAAATPVTSLVSVNTAGTASGGGFALKSAISADGSTVVFESTGSGFVTNDTNGAIQDIFARTFTGTPTTHLVSQNTTGGSGSNLSANPAISADGSVVAFESLAANLVANDTNNRRDIFARSIGASPSTTLISQDVDGGGSDSHSFAPSISADGNIVAFRSSARDLTLDQYNGFSANIFARRINDPLTVLVSTNQDDTGSSRGSSNNLAISADGSAVVFDSFGDDVAANDLNGSQDVFIADLVERSGMPQVAFAATRFDGQVELFHSDGTQDGTGILKNVGGSQDSTPHELTIVGDDLFFAATGADGEVELFRTTELGITARVKDLAGNVSSNPHELTAYDGLLFFSATGPDGQTELYKSDGTNTGTVRVKNLSSTVSAAPQDLTVFAGKLYFTATDGTNRELYVSDGTGPGTQRVRNLYGSTTDSDPSNLTVVGNMLYFVAMTPSGGRELHKSDGTNGGTGLVFDIDGAFSSQPNHLTAFHNQIYFTATGANGQTELWKSDGLVTEQVRDLSGTTSSNPNNLTVLNEKLYFVATTANGQQELHVTDGTSHGTELFVNLHGTVNASPNELTTAGNRLFFSALGGDGEREFYSSDGTASGTARLKDIGGTFSSNPHNITSAGDSVYFSASLSATQTELYRSNGTETSLVKNLAGNPAPHEIVPFQLAIPLASTPAPTPSVSQENNGSAIENSQTNLSYLNPSRSPSLQSHRQSTTRTMRTIESSTVDEEQSEMQAVVFDWLFAAYAN